LASAVQRESFTDEERQPVEIIIDNKIMVDVATSQDVNPNYTLPSIFKSSGSVDVWGILDHLPSPKPDESTLKKSMNINKFSAEYLQLLALKYFKSELMVVPDTSSGDAHNRECRARLQGPTL
jgi:hypothetical protein